MTNAKGKKQLVAGRLSSCCLSKQCAINPAEALDYSLFHDKGKKRKNTEGGKGRTKDRTGAYTPLLMVHIDQEAQVGRFTKGQSHHRRP